MKKKNILILITLIGFSNILLYSNFYFRVNLSDISKNGVNSEFSPSLSSSFSLSPEWNITWGGINSDTGRGIAVDAEDNIYVAGYTSSYGDGLADVCLVKYNSSSILQWNNTWGFTLNDFGHDLVIDNEGNIYVTGYTHGFGVDNEDLCLIKFDSDGDIIWNETYGGSGIDKTNGIAVDSESNVYIVGQTNSFGSNYDIWLVKYNKTGHFQWNETWDGGASDYGDDIIIQSDSSIYITGHTYFGSYSEVCLINYDTTGTQLWNTTWGVINHQKGRALAMDDSESIYITGETYGSGYWDIFLAKFDSSGDHIWNITWGGDNEDNAADITIDGKNIIWIAGSTKSFGAEANDVFLAQYDLTGNRLWNTTWGGSDHEMSRCLIADSSNNIYISGYTASFGAGGADIFILKYLAERPGKSTIIPFGNTYIIFIIIGTLLLITKLIRKRQFKIKKHTHF